MGGAESSSDMASKEQAWAVLVEVLDLLQSRAKVGADFARICNVRIGYVRHS